MCELFALMPKPNFVSKGFYQLFKGLKVVAYTSKAKKK
jgi:hypothetical protein